MYSHPPISHKESMTSHRSDIRNYWREFIEIYKSFPALWKVKSEEYKNRKLKDQCYKILIKKLKEIDPNADRCTVTRKVNILRSNFRRELKKVSWSERANPEEKYKPTLWYFNDMMFLSNQEDTQNDDDCAHTTEIECRDEIIENDNPVDLFDEIDVKSETPTPSTFTEMKSDMRCERPKHVSKRSADDEIELQGKMWACEFRKLNAEQQMFAKKAIDDILFEGRLAGLSRFSVQINGMCNNH